MNDAVRAITFLFNEQNRLKASRASLAGNAEALAECDATIADFRAAELVIFDSYRKREDERERRVAWRAILPECRAALDDVERLAREFEAAGFEEQHQRDAARIAHDRLQEVVDKKPPESRYPNERELAKHAEHVAEAKKLYSEALAVAQAARNHQQTVLAEFQSAEQKLQRLQFRERQLKPRVETPEGLFTGVK